MNKEIWKDIPNYEGQYQVSNLGNVRSLQFRNGTCTINRIRTLKIKTSGKYNHTKLFKNGKGKNYTIHRLVAITFIPNPNNYKYVNHKDENPRNNKVDNLEWCTMQYNNVYGNRIAKSVKKQSIKINQYDLNNCFIKTWNSMNDAIRYYNNRHILDVCKEKRKTASGYIWKYC